MQRRKTWLVLLAAVLAGLLGGLSGAAGLGLASARSAQITESSALAAITNPKPGPFQPVSPKRIYATAGGTTKIQASVPRTFRVHSTAHNATAVVLGITVSGGSGAGALTAYPGGEQKPAGVTTMNYPAASSTTASVTVKLGTSDQVTLAITSGTVDVAVVLQGYYLPPTNGPEGHIAWARFKANGQKVNAFNNRGGITATPQAPGFYLVRVGGVKNNLQVHVQTTVIDDVVVSPQIICSVAVTRQPGEFQVSCFNAFLGHSSPTGFNFWLTE